MAIPFKYTTNKVSYYYLRVVWGRRLKQLFGGFFILLDSHFLRRFLFETLRPHSSTHNSIHNRHPLAKKSSRSMCNNPFIPFHTVDATSTTPGLRYTFYYYYYSLSIFPIGFVGWKKTFIFFQCLVRNTKFLYNDRFSPSK